MLDVRADKQWLTAAEAAAEQLPGFCFTEQHVRRLIASGDLRARNRTARGGGREFHWSELPAQARAEYLKRYGIAAHDDAGIREPLLEAEARAAIVAVARTFLNARNLPVGSGLKKFCAAYLARRAGCEPWIYEAIAQLAPHKIACWERKLRCGGSIKALIDGRGRPAKPRTWIDDDSQLKTFIIATITAQPHLSAVTLLEKHIVERLGRRDVPLRTLQAFLVPYRPKNNALMKMMVDPDKGRSHHKAALGSRSQGIVRANQLWEIDATRGDCLCILPDGSSKRPAITLVVDVATRRGLAVVSDQPSGAATRALVRRACLEWGIPEKLKIDNGKEFENFATRRLLRDIGVEVTNCPPFNPDHKPHVERMFGTLLRGYFEQLPGYVGHSVADRKAIEGRKSFAHRFGQERQLLFQVQLSPAELQAGIDRWLAQVYGEKIHSELRVPPNFKARELTTVLPPRRVEDARLFDALLMNAHIRTISKGVIRLDNRFYGSQDTGALELTQPGRRVEIRIDPLDPSWIAVYSADGETFLTIARDLDALEPTERQRVAREALANQNTVVRLFDQRLRAARRQPPFIGASDPAPPALLSPESADAMRAANLPALVQQQKMITAKAESEMPPQPIEPTEEERAASIAFLDAATPKARVGGVLQCGSYTRPDFNDVEDHLVEPMFYLWAQAHLAAGNRLDRDDSRWFADLSRDEFFKHRLANEEARQRAIA
jgi:putative transposase